MCTHVSVAMVSLFLLDCSWMTLLDVDVDIELFSSRILVQIDDDDVDTGSCWHSHPNSCELRATMMSLMMTMMMVARQ